VQNRENGAICRFHETPASYKAFSFRGGGALPLTPTRGSVPGPRWALCPQIPIIGSRFALAMCPPTFMISPQVLRGWIKHWSVVTLAHPPTRSSLKITNRSFRFAAPCLWNELPTDLREPRQTQSPSLSPITHGSSSLSSLSPLPYSLTRSVFHSELNTWLFGKPFPP